MDELKVTFGGRAYRFPPGQAVRIGRSADNTIVIPDPTVSRSHACVTWKQHGWQLDDLGKGRTYVGGLAVASVPVRQPLEVHLANPLGPELPEPPEPHAPALPSTCRQSERLPTAPSMEPVELITAARVIAKPVPAVRRMLRAF